jgi:hypothetical protein
VFGSGNVETFEAEQSTVQAVLPPQHEGVLHIETTPRCATVLPGAICSVTCVPKQAVAT